MNGNLSLLAIVTLRGTALALSLAGQSRTAAALYTLADAYESGKAVDDHMAAVAEKLKTRAANDSDWDDVISRIEADSARLQSAALPTG